MNHMSISEQYLQSDESYQGSGVPRYKLDGRLGGFCRYDKEGVEMERVTSIEGVVSRISIQEFVSAFDDEEKVELELDIKSKAIGSVRAVVNLQTFTGLSFAEGVALAQQTDDMVLNIGTKIADKKNSYGGNIVYTNVAELTESGWTTLRPDYTGDDKAARLESVRKELSRHPLWKVRVYTQESEHSDGPFGVVLEAIKAKGWPQWDESTDTAYMGVFNKVLGTSFSDPNEFSGDRCETLVMSIQKAKSIPKPVSDAIVDPFAD